MPSLRDIKRRMDTVKSTMQITRTMEMVSTAKVQTALRRAEEAAPYRDAMTQILASVADADTGRARFPLLEEHKQIKHVVYVVIASDRGLAGGFNLQLQRYALGEMNKLKRRGIASSVITCGKKPTEFFRYRKIEPALSFEGISGEPTQEEAEEISSYLIDAYTEGDVDRVILCYQHAKNRVDQEMVVRQMLPISMEEIALPNAPRTDEAQSVVTEHVSAARRNVDFEFEPSAKEVLGYLLPRYVRTVIHHSLLDSAAAEHGARRRAMQSATDNAREIITTLERTYNRVRQGSITTEINEIVGGASALEES